MTPAFLTPPPQRRRSYFVGLRGATSGSRRSRYSVIAFVTTSVAVVRSPYFAANASTNESRRSSIGSESRYETDRCFTWERSFAMPPNGTGKHVGGRNEMTAVLDIAVQYDTNTAVVKTARKD